MRALRIDAQGMGYTELNRLSRQAVADGIREIVLDGVMGQRFIADGLRGEVKITIHGVPGGDLGMFMSGPTLVVHGNCEHAPGNTMDEGTIVIHGSAGDAVAHSMRGGKILVRDSIGYRGGIHMKQYGTKHPVLLIGGSARAFLGEYMAGGLIIVLGLHGEAPMRDRGIGTGIHGGEIFIRGRIERELLGVGAAILQCGEEERERIAPLIREAGRLFGFDGEEIVEDDFTRIGPSSSRPFAEKYTWER